MSVFIIITILFTIKFNKYLKKCLWVKLAILTKKLLKRLYLLLFNCKTTVRQ